MAVPLAALGLCDSSPPYLCRLLSLLILSSCCPVEMIIKSEHKSDLVAKLYLQSNYYTRIKHNPSKIEASFHLST